MRKKLSALLALFTLFPFLFGLGPVHAKAAGKEIFLTFDDGPSTVVTERILDILGEEDIKATFFIVGERVKGREKTLRRIAREGHTLGVHSETHVYADIYRSAQALAADADACAETIRRVTGVNPRVYRFPGGGEHPAAAELLRRKGYTIVDWNAVCGDEEIRGADAETLFRTAVNTAKGKGRVVLLCHDSAPHRATAEALPKIIAHFRAEGYTFSAF